MESNGKTITSGDNPNCSGPFVFGGVGTNVQHSFYQYLHQANRKFVLETIGFKDQKYIYDDPNFKEFSQDIQTLTKESNTQLLAN